MIARLLDLDPYALFIAYGVIFGVVLTLSAAADAVRTHRSPR